MENKRAFKKEHCLFSSANLRVQDNKSLNEDTDIKLIYNFLNKTINFGKYTGKQIKDIIKKDFQYYVSLCDNTFLLLELMNEKEETIQRLCKIMPDVLIKDTKEYRHLRFLIKFNTLL